MIGGRNFAERRPEEVQEAAAQGPLELVEADALPPELEPLQLSTPFDAEEDSGVTGRMRPSVLPWVAMLVVLAWIGAAVWFALPDLVGAPPLRLVEFAAALCVPPALIGVVWLLALRNSRAEARRFAHTAQAMRSESAALERTLAILSREIDTNRRHLAEQTHALMAMGDGAAERLAAISNGMAHEMGAVDAGARKLAEAAAGAQTSLGVLLASLPRAHGELSDMGRTLDSIALTAGERAAGLDVQLVALGERGREADAVAGGAAQRLAAHLQRMEATSETAGQRLEAVTADMSDAVDALLGRTAGAVDEARKGITAQGDAILAMLSANQAALDQTIRSTVEALADRIATVESMVDRLGTRLHEQGAATDALIGRVHGGFGDIEGRLESLHATGMDRTQALAAAISALGGSADAMTEALRTGEAQAHATIQTTDTLLTALDAAAREIDETLPEALTRLDARITESRGVVVAAKPELLALVTAAESTHGAIEAIAGVIQQQRATLDHMTETLRDALEQGRGQAETVGAQMEAAIGRTEDFAQAAAPRLIEALMRVRDTAATAAERARETLSSVIPDAARQLETATSAAMERAVGTGTERQLRAIAEAAELAVEAAQRASDRLNRQLLSIGEASAAVERRIEEAEIERQAAEEENFARRAALLIEAMNSAAIDITKSSSAEVSDTAWSAYLKGDRGVFTRRAVRLLEPSEAREIARLYDNDAGFRESVNRYIHDFEAMLRGVLAQRDGAPMSVTLLSSDMGKLYVILAQAIERLRA